MRQRWTLAIVILLAALALWGMRFDAAPTLSIKELLIAFLIASASGATLGVVAATYFQRDAVSKRRLVILTLVTLIAWRLSYFPVMVLAGTIAAFSEQILHGLGSSAWVYPPFLLAIAALHFVATALASQAALGAGAKYRALALPFVAAMLMSFTALDDLRLFPDPTWRFDPPLVTATAPRENVYLQCLAERPPLARRPLLLAAGATYGLIPQSPWSRQVQGALEQMFRENPQGSSTERVVEHYQAYRAAHGELRP